MKQPKATALFKINHLDAELKKRIEAAFTRQGVDNTEGVHRLFRFFVEWEDLQPLLLDQVRGMNRKDLARAILRRMGK